MLLFAFYILNIYTNTKNGLKCDKLTNYMSYQKKSPSKKTEISYFK